MASSASSTQIQFFNFILFNHLTLKRRDRHFPIAWDLLIIQFHGHRHRLAGCIPPEGRQLGQLIGSKRGYVKGNVKGKLGKTDNPPDLWIHHDQMGIKDMDKSQRRNSASSSRGFCRLPDVARSRFSRRNLPSTCCASLTPYRSLPYICRLLSQFHIFSH